MTNSSPEPAPAPPTRKLRIAVVGAGLIGRRHIEAVERSRGAEIACVVDPDPAAKALARRIDRPWSANIDEALSAHRPDGAIVATPNHLHADHGVACVRAGVPALIEKPFADTAAAAAKVLEEAEAANVPLLIGHHRRHNPLIRAAKARIDSGELGKIVAVHAAFWLYKPADYFNLEWRTRPGAGPVFINLIHDIDLLRHLVGEVEAVQAFEANETRGHGVEDTAAVILKFTGGALGTVTVSDAIVSPWSWELTAAENPAYPRSEQVCYQIGGTCGSLEIPTGAVWSQDGERSWWRPIRRDVHEVEPADPLDVQIDHFCDVIGGAAPLVSGREGLRSLAVLEAIKRAAAAGGTVRVDPLL